MGQLQSPSLVLFPVLGLCCGTFSPSRHRVISEGWNKNAACPSCVLHVQSLTQFLPKWSYFIWKEGERWGGRFGCGGKGMLHLFPGLLGLWPWLGQPEALARIAFFSHWVQQWRRVFGVFFFSPPCGKFSGKYNWYLPPKLFQSVTKYLCGYFVQGTKCLYLIKSLQNCLITVLNVRHLCNLNVRYKFNFWVSSIIFLLKKENNFQIELE